MWKLKLITLKNKCSESLYDLVLDNLFNKRTMDKLGWIKNTKLLCLNRDYLESEKTTYTTGENNHYNSTMKIKLIQLIDGQIIWISIDPKKIYTWLINTWKYI